MLQNRVDPFGNIIATKARGAFMGNRGVIHDQDKNIVRNFRLKAWLTCVLEFKGRRLEVMAPNRYTQLFFLDEATAFSAGHRPCAECRRAAFNRFRECWTSGNPEYGFNHKTSIGSIDAILHEERMHRKEGKYTYEENIDALPNGTFILHNDRPFLVVENLVHEWTPFGYQQGITRSVSKKVLVLTPKSIVRAFGEGYLPHWALI
jgi:hypothetical protein